MPASPYAAAIVCFQCLMYCLALEGLMFGLICSSKPESTAAPPVGEQSTATGAVTHEAVSMQSDDLAQPAAPVHGTGASLNSLPPQQHQAQQMAYSAAPFQGQQQTSHYPGAYHLETAQQPVAQT